MAEKNPSESWFASGKREQYMPNSTKLGEKVINVGDALTSAPAQLPREDVSQQELDALRSEIEIIMTELSARNPERFNAIWLKEKIAIIDGQYKLVQKESDDAKDVPRFHAKKELGPLLLHVQTLLTSTPKIVAEMKTEALSTVPPPIPHMEMNAEGGAKPNVEEQIAEARLFLSKNDVPAVSVEESVEDATKEEVAGGKLELWDEPTGDGAERIFHTKPEKTTTGALRITWIVPPSRIGEKSAYVKGVKDEVGNLLVTVKKRGTRYDSYLKMRKLVDLDGSESPAANGIHPNIMSVEQELQKLRADQPGDFLPPKREDVAKGVDTAELLRRLDAIIGP